MFFGLAVPPMLENQHYKINVRIDMPQNLRAKEVDKIFAEWNKSDTPGCVLAVIQNGEIIYQQAYGMADLEHDVPLKPESVFDIASISKQFVAACITVLVEQGQVSLDDDIRQYIPEMPEYDCPITIRHLIHHTNGIRDYMALMYLADWRHENSYHPAELTALIARQKALNFQPGEKYGYNNSGYFFLGEIIIRVSGKSLNDYATETIFGPLGMTATHFFDDCRRIVKNRAISYVSTDDADLGYATYPYIFDIIGDTGLLTTIGDLYLWDQNFYDNRIGSADQALIDHLLEPGKLNNGEALDYAFGLFLDTYQGLPTISHSGGAAAYRSEMIRFPEQQFSIILLSNSGEMKPVEMAKQVADIYLKDHLEPEDHTFKETSQVNDDTNKVMTNETVIQSLNLNEYVGYYYCDELNVTYTVHLENDQLFLRRGLNPVEQSLQPKDEHKFLSTGMGEQSYVFARDDGGKIAGFNITTWGVDNLRFEKQTK